MVGDGSNAAEGAGNWPAASRHQRATRGRRRRKRPRPARRLALLLLLAVMLYVIAFPLVQHFFSPTVNDPRRAILRLPLAEAIHQRALEVFTVSWLFMLGASIGSFLNVVIYRSPRGMTLLGPSRCPRCRQPIRAWHNLPVFGWLMLRGRCYDCRLPISPRYPIVESIVGGTFVLLAFVELFTGGANLPACTHIHRVGIAWIVFDPQWDLIRIYGLHAVTLSVLLSWGLIQWDRQHIPPGYFGLVWLAAIVLATVDPHVLPVGWHRGLPWAVVPDPRLAGLATAAAGLLAAGLAAAGLVRLGGCPRRYRAESIGAMALAGLVVGWQTSITLAVVTAALRWLQIKTIRTIAMRRAWVLAVWAALFLVLLMWRWIVVAMEMVGLV